MPMVLAVMGKYFPSPTAQTGLYCSNPALFEKVAKDLSTLVAAPLLEALKLTGRVPVSGDVKYIFVTKPGPGPLRQGPEESLLDPATGATKPPSSKHKRLQIGGASPVSKGVKGADILKYVDGFLVGSVVASVLCFLAFRGRKL